VCGVPLGAIPLATAVALEGEWPALLLRPARKAHGTGQLVEGAKSEDPLRRRVALLEDVCTTGSSVRTARSQLEQAGFTVVVIACVVDRGDKTDSLHDDFEIRSLMHVPLTTTTTMTATSTTTTTTTMTPTSSRGIDGKDEAHAGEAATIVSGGGVNVGGDGSGGSVAAVSGARLRARIRAASSCLCVAADVTSMRALCDLVDAVATEGKVCIVKTHCDTIADFSLSAMLALKRRHGDSVVFWEDRKFADTAHTTSMQVRCVRKCVLCIRLCDITVVFSNTRVF
jgi:hypothetical protein